MGAPLRPKLKSCLIYTYIHQKGLRYKRHTLNRKHVHIHLTTSGSSNVQAHSSHFGGQVNHDRHLHREVPHIIHDRGINHNRAAIGREARPIRRVVVAAHVQPRPFPVRYGAEERIPVPLHVPRGRAVRDQYVHPVRDPVEDVVLRLGVLPKPLQLLSSGKKTRSRLCDEVLTRRLDQVGKLQGQQIGGCSSECSDPGYGPLPPSAPLSGSVLSRISATAHAASPGRRCSRSGPRPWRACRTPAARWAVARCRPAPGQHGHIKVSHRKCSWPWWW
jgi:hypothetical protein